MRKYFADRPFFKRGAIIITLVVVVWLLMLFAGHPHAVEAYYSQGLYPAICGVLHTLMNAFPFSVGDLLYILVVAYLLYSLGRLVYLLIKARFRQAGLLATGLVIGVQTAIILFYVLWGLNYFRPSAAERLKLKETPFTVIELQRVTTMLIDSANVTRARLSPAEMVQTNDTIFERAVLAVEKLSRTSKHFRTYKPEIKPSLLTPLMNYISTSGYYNPFTTEAQLNYAQPVFARPFVACHEMSHQMGYGAEDEANFVGFLAAEESNDKLLRYSAYHLAVGEFMFTLRGADTTLHKKLKERISPAVKADFKQEREYWLAYQNRLNKLSGIFYDNFLKANNQSHGLDTYNRMVTLLMAIYRE